MTTSMHRSQVCPISHGDTVLITSCCSCLHCKHPHYRIEYHLLSTSHRRFTRGHSCTALLSHALSTRAVFQPTFQSRTSSCKSQILATQIYTGLASHSLQMPWKGRVHRRSSPQVRSGQRKYHSGQNCIFWPSYFDGRNA